LTLIGVYDYALRQVGDECIENRPGAAAVRSPRHTAIRQTGRDIVASTPLSDVQRANLTILLLIRDAGRDDPGAACCKFGLDLAQLRTINELSPEAILTVVTDMGNEALFCPRHDLCSLLTLPARVSAIVASARPRIAAPAAQGSLI